MEAVAEDGIEDMRRHLFPIHKPRLKDGRTCAMHWGGQEVHSWTDYILGTYSRILQNVVFQDARHNM